MHKSVVITGIVALPYLLSAQNSGGTGAAGGREGRRITVADVIATRTVGNGRNEAAYSMDDVGTLSPDGQRFIVVMRQPDLATNVVRSWLLVFKTAAVFLDGEPIRPDTALVLASGSNAPAIEQVRWLRDNETLLFLGAPGTAAPQVMQFSLRTRHFERVTNAVTGVQKYVAAADGGTIVYTADPPPDSAFLRRVGATGFAVHPNQMVDDVMLGRWDVGYNDSSPRQFDKSETFVLDRHTGVSRRVPALDDCHLSIGGMALSPDGRQVAAVCPRSPAPPGWGKYGDAAFHKESEWAGVQHLESLTVFDLAGDRQRTLIETPSGVWEQFVWAPDSRTLIVANTYLPTDDTTAATANRRGEYTLAEVDASARAVTPIAYGDTLMAPVWDAASGVLSLRTRDGSRVVMYQKQDGRWNKTGAGHDRGSGTSGGRIGETAKPAARPVFRLVQDLNTPPTIEATDALTGQHVMLIDLNPQLRQFRLGHVEVIRWTTSYGDTFSGGLYLPPDYVAGHRYPLVVQPHGFPEHEFELDGLYRTAKAAQALAAHDIAVLEIDYTSPLHFGTSEEAPREIAATEGAIDTLDRRGLIDRTKVGVIGFSRGCWQVEYMITHPDPRFPLAAASITDGVDYGYVQRVTWGPAAAADFDAMNGGGPPSGATLGQWIKTAPGFNVDKVHTPLWITALSPASVLSEWEIYGGLLLLGKPVELTYIPDGSHPLVKPWELRTSQQGTVDWFTFWLTGEEDPDPAKAKQYTRWHRLRAMRDSGLTKAAAVERQ